MPEERQTIPIARQKEGVLSAVDFGEREKNKSLCMANENRNANQLQILSISDKQLYKNRKWRQ